MASVGASKKRCVRGQVHSAHLFNTGDALARSDSPVEILSWQQLHFHKFRVCMRCTWTVVMKREERKDGREEGREGGREAGRE